MLKTVKVTTDSGYTYETNVSEQSTKESINDYFVGNRIDIGVFPVERMETVVSAVIV